MRLCLVSSILALIVSIHGNLTQGHSLWLLMITLLSLSLWVQMTVFKLKPKRALALASLLAFVFYATHHYSQEWLQSALESRLQAQYSGITIKGRGGVVTCDLSKSNMEKIQLDVQPKSVEVISDSKKSFTKPSLSLTRLSLVNYLGANDTKQQILCGSSIEFIAKLRAPYSFINPASFDYEAWLLSKGVDATGYLKSYRLLNRHNDMNATGLVLLRQAGLKRASEVNGLAGQIVPALLFGETGYLDKQYWDLLQLTGAVHLLVVSGLHIGFVALLVLFLWHKLVQLEMFFGRQRSLLQRFTPVMLVVCCLVYAYMAGMGLAVQRSSLMLVLAVVVSFYRGHWSLLDSWLWVMWLVLMLNPLISRFVGFWFSFAAVGCLLLAYSGRLVALPLQSRKRIALALKPKRPRDKVGMLGLLVFRFIEAFIRPQWVVFLAIMPFLWLFFQPQSIASLFVNAIAIPLLAFLILPFSILGLIFTDGIFVQVLNVVLLTGFQLLDLVAEQKHWLVYKPHGIWLLFLPPIVVVALSVKGMPFRRLSLFLLAAIYLLPLRVLENTLIVFDVGQGLAVYGATHDDQGEFHWLYDTGAKFRSGFSIGESVVARNLLVKMDAELDLLVVSHSDNDHAGGQVGLLKHLKAVELLAGQPNAISERHCHQRDSGWKIEAGLKWRVLSVALQDGRRKLTDNNQSCIVQFEFQGIRILIPGDIEALIERKLVQEYKEELASDILLVPHHGSKSSSSELFIRAVSPKIAIISSGFNNPFNHPHPSVVERLQRLEIAVYNTADSGAVEVDLDDFSLLEWRKQSPPIWRQM